MGKYIKGILGSFQGKVGTVVGSTWKGIKYMKSLGGKRTKPASARQLVQQAKFAMMVKFVSSMSRLLLTTFKNSAIEMTGANSAFSYNFRNAITGIYPALAVDFSKVLISKGQLIPAANPVAAATGNGDIKFDWDDNSGLAMANATDKSILVAFCAELNRAAYVVPGTDRSSKTGVLTAGIFAGKLVETWISFISEDENDIATSVYTGQVTVS